MYAVMQRMLRSGGILGRLDWVWAVVSYGCDQHLVSYGCDQHLGTDCFLAAPKGMPLIRIIIKGPQGLCI